MKLLLLSFFFLSGSVFAAITDVRFELIKDESTLTNLFFVRIVFTKSNGKTVIAEPGEKTVRWQQFKFSGDNNILMFENGVGRFKIQENFAGADSAVIRISSGSYDLEVNKIVIPLVYCTGIQLNSRIIEFGSPLSPEWEMKMSNGITQKLDKKWFDVSNLEFMENPDISYSNHQFHYNIASQNRNPELYYRIKGGRELFTLLKTFTVKFPSYASFDFSGRNGRSGINGVKGSSEGGSGTNGGKGEDGTDAEDVVLFATKTLDLDSTELLLVYVIGSGNTKRKVLLDYSSSIISIKANGGNGGNGGAGGSGGSAVQTDKTEYNQLQEGGNGGNGGYGGVGGRGGDILIILDESAKNAEKKFECNKCRGKSGSGGSAGFVRKRR